MSDCCHPDISLVCLVAIKSEGLDLHLIVLPEVCAGFIQIFPQILNCMQQKNRSQRTEILSELQNLSVILIKIPVLKKLDHILK
jgi:hypothetical protein